MTSRCLHVFTSMMLLTIAAGISPSLKGSKTSSDFSRADVSQRSRITIGIPFVQHHMTVCNAYHAAAPLEILHVEQRMVLTKDSPLRYKDCREFTLPLVEGDRLDFKSSGTTVGTFHITSMPKASASLLLIPRHREGSSRALTFDSHAFADLTSPQIAVVDAYLGNDTRTVNIIENLGQAEAAQIPLTEALRYNSVVAVSPGKYDIALFSSGTGENITAMPLRAGARAKCVVMRVGGGMHNGVEVPQELVVFPNSSFGQWLSSSIFLVVSLLFLRERY